MQPRDPGRDNATNPGRDRGAGKGTRDQSSGGDSTVPRVDVGNPTTAEIATAKLLHEQGIAWWLCCLHLAWRRQYPHQHIGPQGTRLLAESAAEGKAKQRGGAR